jgi:hypothetical protein
MKYLKIISAVILLVLGTSLAYSDTNVYFFGKGNFVNSAGSEADYKEGENDFPIMSSHQTFGGGFGLTFGSRGAFFGIEGHYNLSGEAVLTDPSDNDTVNIETYKYASGFLTLGFNIINKNSLRLYISGGGGVSYSLGAEMETYTSGGGYETHIEVPEKKYPLTGFGGIGVEIYFSPTSGLLLSGRYLYAGLDQPQTMIVAMVGLVFRL